MPMGDLVELRLAQQRRWQERTAAAAQHPTLRWCAGECYWLAHARDHETGRACCGAPGTLMLAPPGVPRCTDCYPPAFRALGAVDLELEP